MVDFPIKTSIYKGFSMAFHGYVSHNQMVLVFTTKSSHGRPEWLHPKLGSLCQVGLHGRTPGRGEKIQEIQEGQGESGYWGCRGCQWEKTNWTWRILSPKAKWPNMTNRPANQAEGFPSVSASVSGELRFWFSLGCRFNVRAHRVSGTASGHFGISIGPCPKRWWGWPSPFLQLARVGPKNL